MCMILIKNILKNSGKQQKNNLVRILLVYIKLYALTERTRPDRDSNPGHGRPLRRLTPPFESERKVPHQTLTKVIL